MNINDLIRIIKKAGQEVLKIYNNDFEYEFKKDNSPLTLADKKSHEIISSELNKLFPEIPILSEEGDNISYEKRKKWNKFWLIDPLDGTKEFVNKNGEFTINIALIKEKFPVLGLVYVPVKNVLYYASEEGSYKIENEKKLRLPLHFDSDRFLVVASKSHFNEETKKYINELRNNHENLDLVNAGSSLKLCLVAEGKANIYPRLGSTMEWDTAAAHAIVKFAGKNVLKYNSDKELEYNKENLLNPFFIVK